MSSLFGSACGDPCSCAAGACTRDQIAYDYKITSYDQTLFTLPADVEPCLRGFWDGTQYPWDPAHPYCEGSPCVPVTITDWNGKDINWDIGAEYAYFASNASKTILSQYLAQANMNVFNDGVCAVELQIGYYNIYGTGVSLWVGRCNIAAGPFSGGVFTRTSGCSTTPPTLTISLMP